MKDFKLDDLAYKGQYEEVHNWDFNGQPYYWHPDWMHVAEDAMGIFPKAPIDVPEGEEATQEHAEAAIIKHLSDEDK